MPGGMPVHTLMLCTWVNVYRDYIPVESDLSTEFFRGSVNRHNGNWIALMH
jgi:hypothetical protein